MYKSEIFDSPYRVSRTSVYRPDPVDVRASTYTAYKPGESYSSTTYYPSGSFTSYAKNYDYPRASTVTTTVHRSPSADIPSYRRYHWPVSSSTATFGNGEYKSTYTSYSPSYTYKKEVDYSPSRYSTASTTYESPTRTSVIHRDYDGGVRTTTTSYSPLRSSYTYRTLYSPRYPTYTSYTFNYGRPWRYFSSPSSYYSSYLYRPSYLAKETKTTTYTTEYPRYYSSYYPSYYSSYYPRTYSYVETVTEPKVLERTSVTYKDDYLSDVRPSYTTSTYVSRGGLADRVVETTYSPSRTIETRIYDPIDVASKYDSVVRSTYYY